MAKPVKTQLDWPERLNLSRRSDSPMQRPIANLSHGSSKIIGGTGGGGGVTTSKGSDANAT